MHILANFVIFDDFGHFNRKMDILDLFWGPLTASCPKVTIYLPLNPRTSQDLLKTLLFWPNFASFWTPFEGPEGGCRQAPLRAAFGLEDLLRASQTHARDPKFWLFWPLLDLLWDLEMTSFWTILALKPHDLAICSVQIGPFGGTWPKPCEIVNFGLFWLFSLLKKSIFVILPIRGQWKCHFDPILPHFEPSWAQILASGQNVPICSFAWRDLEDPKFDPILTILDPFEGSWGRLQLGPHASCLWAGGPAQSLTNPCLGPQILAILTTFGPPVRPQKWPHFGPFWPLKPHDLAICSVQIGPFWRLLTQTLWKCQFWPILVIFLLKKSILSFCLSGVSENAILTLFWPHFEPSWPQLLAPGQNVPICSPCLEGPWRDLEGPWGTPNLTLFWPFWTPLRVLREAAARPRAQAAFGLEDLFGASQTHARDLKFWSFWPLLDLLWTSKWPHFDHFGP